MNIKNKTVKIIIVSIIILFVEYFLISRIGLFYNIILSFWGLKYLKEQDYSSIKIILIMMILPILFGEILVINALMNS